MSKVDRDLVDRDLAVRLVAAAARRVHDHQEMLSQLDAVAGDGDHGVNMSTALGEADRRAGQGDQATAAEVFKAAGSAFHDTVGGAAGALFGAFFRAVAGGLGRSAEPGPADLVAGLEKGVARVTRVGRSEPGQKTMLDAMAPAVSAARTTREAGGTLASVLRSAAEAARDGAGATAAMRPSAGRARYASDRSLGTEDPGANTVALIFEAWADEISGGKHE
ncbi:MAG: dihydroxyacetone kinase subunit DhaL [bacterium]|nr:dihydroxyacetone kinase subunit DhaL [bacterium]